MRTELYAVLFLTGAGCEREARLFVEPAALSVPAEPEAPSQSLHPAVRDPAPALRRPMSLSPYDGNAWAVSEGKRYFVWFNCNGCHGQGGGGEGPALMDERWRYGSEAGNVFASIVEGRPNGMPSYRGKLTQQQTWQLVAYVRALAGILRLDVQPSRSDTLSGHSPEVMRKHRRPFPPRPEGVP